MARCDLLEASIGAAEAGADDASALKSVDTSVIPPRFDRLALELVLGRPRSSSDMVDSPERRFRESESPSAHEVRDRWPGLLVSELAFKSNFESGGRGGGALAGTSGGSFVVASNEALLASYGESRR